MKIKWIGPKRFVPRLGEIDTDDIRDIPADMAKGFISQRLAKIYKPSKKKKKE